MQRRSYEELAKLTLIHSDDVSQGLSPEDYNVTASADFTVTVDEENPMD